MSDTNDLRELVQKAAAGDKASFEELYLTTCRYVYFTCLGFLKDDQEAQDVTQDVYLTVFKQLGTLEDTDKFRAWLYRIAANKSMKRLKKKRPLLPGDEQLQDIETEENENFLPEEYALNADKRELVLDIIRKTCSDVMYQTILLYYFNGFSIVEIGEIMECPQDTVKKRLSVARSKIKEGVLRYEKQSGDKLYAFAAIPFLTAWFTAQLQDMEMPSLSPAFLDVLPQSTLAAAAAETGGSMILKSLQLKIVAGIAAAVVAVGGITAAVIIHNQNAEEALVNWQEENGTDMADAGNAGSLENAPESEGGGTKPGEETLPTESGTETGETVGEVTADESEAAEEPKPAEESESAETTPAPTAEPEVQYTYTDLDAIMYAKQTVNIRNLPSTNGTKVGALSANDEITVTGQCNETGWYRFEYNGSIAYVSNNYVSDTKIEVPAPAETADQASANNSGGGNSNDDERLAEMIEKYGMYTWNDFGNWFVYICASTDEKPPTECQDVHDILYNRYWDGVNDLYIDCTSNEGLYFSQDVYVWFACISHPIPQELKNFIYKYGAPGAINNHYYGLWLDY